MKWDPKKRQRYMEWAFLISIFALYLIWAIVLPYNEGPDEYMRYRVPEFIYQYGYLPSGDEPLIRDPNWGISYAYQPMLSYIISAFFMKVTSFFSTAPEAILLAARMTSVLSSVGTGYFALKIGKRFFQNIYLWVFVVLITFLPQFGFISGYTSCEAFSIFTVSWITYALLKGTEDGWRIKTSVFLGVGLGLCALSYYYAYGIIVCAIFYAIASVLAKPDLTKQEKVRLLASRVLIVAGVAFLVCGWWFIRNYFLYDGDFLGRTASAISGEKYAIEALKPSNNATPYSRGLSLLEMLVGMAWIDTTVKSFIAVFGYLTVWMPLMYYRVFFGFLFVGACAWVVLRQKKSEYPMFHAAMVLMCVITLGLSLYYSYFSDFQAQGRYLLPAIVSFAFLIASGWQKLLTRLPGKVGAVCGQLICIGLFSACMYALTMHAIPYWY